MIEESILKNEAKKIIASKAKRVYIYAIIGLVFASILVYNQYKNIRFTFGIVMPLTLVVAVLTLWLSLYMQRKMIEGKTYYLDDEIVSLSDRHGKTTFNLNEITDIKEKKIGLIISAGNNELVFPSYLIKYQEFKKRLL